MQSSVDPSKVSATVTGAIITASSAIVWVAQWAHFPLVQGDVQALATGLGMTAGLIWAIAGLIRKVLVGKSV